MGRPTQIDVVCFPIYASIPEPVIPATLSLFTSGRKTRRLAFKVETLGSSEPDIPVWAAKSNFLLLAYRQFTESDDRGLFVGTFAHNQSLTSLFFPGRRVT